MRLLRTLLILFIAFAIPLQGFAAVLKSCAGSHERIVIGVQDQHAHHAASAHHVHDADDAPALSVAASGGHHELSDDVADMAQQECSACATCCSFMAAPVQLLTGTHLPLSDRRSNALPGPVVAFETGGQERPPRTPLV